MSTNSSLISLQQTITDSPGAVESATRALDWRFRYINLTESPLLSTLYTSLLEKITAKEGCPAYLVPSTPITKIAPSRLAVFQEQAQMLPKLNPEELVEAGVNLPSIPSILQELNSAINSSTFSSNAISAIILKDPNLAAWILRLINSAFYGFSGTIDTISRAVTLLGTTQLQKIVASGILSSFLRSVRSRFIYMDKFWQHSMAVAIAAEKIWELSNRPTPEKMFVAGQLHDIGQLTLACLAPERADLTWQFSFASDHFLADVEKNFLGFDHAELGYILLKKWNMPESLQFAVRDHHNSNEPNQNPESSVLKTADMIARAMSLSANNITTLPQYTESSWQSCGIQQKDIPAIIEAISSKLDSLCDIPTIK